MSIGVVITTYNRPEKLRRCLEHIERQTKHPDEVIIVDDGSHMDYTEVKARFSDNPIHMAYYREPRRQRRKKSRNHHRHYGLCLPVRR